MLLTVFLAIVFCAAITMMLLAAVAFIQNKKPYKIWTILASRGEIDDQTKESKQRRNKVQR